MFTKDTKLEDVFSKLEDHEIYEGIYDVTNLPFVKIQDNGRLNEKGAEFVNAAGADNVYVGSAYETYTIFLFAGKPRKIDRPKGVFGNGNCCVLNIPEGVNSIFMSAQND